MYDICLHELRDQIYRWTSPVKHNKHPNFFGDSAQCSPSYSAVSSLPNLFTILATHRQASWQNPLPDS